MLRLSAHQSDPAEAAGPTELAPDILRHSGGTDVTEQTSPYVLSHGLDGDSRLPSPELDSGDGIDSGQGARRTKLGRLGDVYYLPSRRDPQVISVLENTQYSDVILGEKREEIITENGRHSQSAVSGPTNALSSQSSFSESEDSENDVTDRTPVSSSSLSASTSLSTSSLSTAVFQANTQEASDEIA